MLTLLKIIAALVANIERLVSQNIFELWAEKVKRSFHHYSVPLLLPQAEYTVTEIVRCNCIQRNVHHDLDNAKTFLNSTFWSLLGFFLLLLCNFLLRWDTLKNQTNHFKLLAWRDCGNYECKTRVLKCGEENSIVKKYIIKLDQVKIWI